MVNRILNIIKEKGLTCNSVEKQLGFGNGAIKRFATSSPSVDKILRLSNFLNVSVEYIITGKTDVSYPASTSTNSKEREQLLYLFDQLDSINKGKILGRAELLLEEQNETLSRTQKSSPSQVSNPEKADHKQLA